MSDAERLAELLEVGRYLLDEHHLGDDVYRVRERAASLPREDGDDESGWNHPTVVRFGEMCRRLRAACEPQPG